MLQDGERIEPGVKDVREAGKSDDRDADSLTMAAREEGMGTTYKVFAITPSSRPTPIPF